MFNKSKFVKGGRKGLRKPFKKNGVGNYSKGEKTFAGMTVLNFGSQIMFPPRLRINGRVALNSQVAFSSSAVNHNYLDINNPITVSASQNMSGLAWLLSGQETNGTAKAPYVLGIVRKVKIELYVKTSAAPNSGTGALCTLYPLSVGTSTSSMTLTNAEEAWGRSNIVECPLGLDTVTRNKPLIVKRYNLWELAGVSEQEYMNNYALFSFGYSGLLSGVPSIVIDVLSGTESAATETSLQIRQNIIVDMEIELFNRNILITSAPPSYANIDNKEETRFNVNEGEKGNDKFFTKNEEKYEDQYELVRVKKNLVVSKE